MKKNEAKVKVVLEVTYHIEVEARQDYSDVDILEAIDLESSDHEVYIENQTFTNWKIIR